MSENAGQLILTTEFQSYVNERKFKVHLCRKADPESKGMIENVVKYIKGNFAYSRVFSSIEDWNKRALQWLQRTGNQNVHQTTKKDQLKCSPMKSNTYSKSLPYFYMTKWIEAALFKCIQDTLYNANDFRDVVHHLKSLSIESTAKSNRPVLEQVRKGGILVTTRSLETYTNILGGTQ